MGDPNEIILHDCKDLRMKAIILSINESRFQIAVGFSNGEIQLYNLIRTKTRSSGKDKPFRVCVSVKPYSCTLSFQKYCLDESIVVGKVSTLEWTKDGYALAAGYTCGGAVVWSSSGDCLFSTLCVTTKTFVSRNFTPKRFEKNGESG